MLYDPLRKNRLANRFPFCLHNKTFKTLLSLFIGIKRKLCGSKQDIEFKWDEKSYYVYG